MAGAELGLEEHPGRGRHGPQLGHPLGRLPIGDPGVVEARRDEEVGVGARRAVGVLPGHVVVGRVGEHAAVGRLVGQGVAPLLPLTDRQRQLVVEHGGDAVDEGHLGHQAAEELGRLVGHGADEQAAGRSAPADQPARAGDPRVQHVAGAGDEVARTCWPCAPSARPRTRRGPSRRRRARGRWRRRRPGRRARGGGARRTGRCSSRRRRSRRG